MVIGMVLFKNNPELRFWDEGWVDVAYTWHHNCKGYTGAGMSFGQGMVMSYSWVQFCLG